MAAAADTDAVPREIVRDFGRKNSTRADGLDRPFGKPLTQRLLEARLEGRKERSATRDLARGLPECGRGRQEAKEDSERNDERRAWAWMGHFEWISSTSPSERFVRRTTTLT